MNLKKLTPLPIGQQAIIHAALVWAGLTVLDTAFYSYRVATEGYFLFYGNGSPVTVWQRLGETVLRWETLVFLAVAVGVELLYHFVFKWKSIKVFALACVLLSLGTVVVVVLALPPQGSVGAADFLVVFFEVFIYAVLYALTRNLITRQAREAEQRSHHAQAELSTIKAHLNPHFFFNTLNSLYGTAILEKAEKTAQSVEQLAGIMRYVLTEAQEDLTEVANEIKFLQDYLQLQQMRLPARENIKVKTEIIYDGTPALIAPLLLIPFIENAFKYGISLDQDCFVHLCLQVKDRQLEMVLENQLLPERQKDHGAGTGLAHALKRLNLLYPQKHHLVLEEQPHYKVRLRLDMRQIDR